MLGEFPGGEQVHYKEGVFVGYRYNDTFHVEPQFCFGHGLSYTSFSYANPMLCQENGETYVQCEITNTGDREGAEIVQIYRAPKEEGKDCPVQELKGFEKVNLSSGETKCVKIKVEDWDENYVLKIGSSSRDIRLVCGK